MCGEKGGIWEARKGRYACGEPRHDMSPACELASKGL